MLKRPCFSSPSSLVVFIALSPALGSKRSNTLSEKDFILLLEVEHLNSMSIHACLISVNTVAGCGTTLESEISSEFLQLCQGLVAIIGSGISDVVTMLAIQVYLRVALTSLHHIDCVFIFSSA